MVGLLWHAHTDLCQQPQLQPPQAVAILNDRVLQVGRVNTAIADWLQVGDGVVCAAAVPQLMRVTGAKKIGRAILGWSPEARAEITGGYRFGVRAS